MVGSSSVVVVLERGNLGFGVGGYSAIYRAECFCNIIVDTQCFVQKPPSSVGRVHASTQTQATQRIPAAGEIQHLSAMPMRRPQRSESRAGSDNAGPAEPPQLGGEVALERKVSKLFHGDRFHFRFHIRRRCVLFLVVNRSSFHCPSAMVSDRFTRVDQPTIMLRSVSHPSAKTRITCGTTKRM